MKVYLCCIAKYSLICYLNNKHEKDCPFIPYTFSRRSGIYLLRTFKKGLSDNQSEVFQAIICRTK
jgi:hypothetical protein